MNTVKEIQSFVNDTLAACDSGMCGKCIVRFVDHLNDLAGQSRFLKDQNGQHLGVILLDHSFWKEANDRLRRRVISHELAHIMVRYRYEMDCESHGPQWTRQYLSLMEA